MTISTRPILNADIPAIARIHVDGWRSAYASFIPASFLDQFSYEDDRSSFEQWIFHADPLPECQVAVDNGQVIGFTIAGENGDEVTKGYDAEVFKLFVRPEYQGQGIGRRLLNAVAQDLNRRGYQSVVLWAYREGKSAGFYQHLGGEIIYRTQQQVAGKAVDVLVYAWMIKQLIQQTQPHLSIG